MNQRHLVGITGISTSDAAHCATPTAGITLDGRVDGGVNGLLIDLSIVIPAFNEHHKIARDIEAASHFLRDYRLRGEIIVSDDGSEDATAEVAQKAAAEIPPELAKTVSVRLVVAERNRGKGAAVRAGVAVSRGRYVMFADSGVCIPYEQTMRGLDLIRSGQCDIAHASRKRIDSVITNPQPLHRRLLSRVFRTAVNTFIGLPYRLTDTQCGFKVYDGDVARTLYAQCIDDGFLFDLETILRASHLGYRIHEFPVTWSCDPDTRLNPAKQALRTFPELIKVKNAVRDNPTDLGMTKAEARMTNEIRMTNDQ
jgi:dolichyl-phosphate beta-glucosyltransferase